ncbi:MAG: hypothetical protein CMP63_00805 [Flavobacteriales bacterium]|nr:hypothetical protein [Flavobacteriales bacterium]|tara:strand:- start:74 stop:289 length:216 start_codon:yes stop_codon:yes gene_type:complete
MNDSPAAVVNGALKFTFISDGVNKLAILIKRNDDAISILFIQAVLAHMQIQKLMLNKIQISNVFVNQHMDR